jgi:ParB-like chromosome segregation protein Spo0J
MKIEQRKVESLIPYVNNSRKHSDEQVAQIAASIKEFGWTNPILVDGENGIIAGHGRLMAARKLSMEEVPVIELAHLSDNQRKALIIADNKLATNATWDEEILFIEIENLKSFDFNLDLIGFNFEEINGIAENAIIDMPQLDDGDKKPFQQKAFILHDEQAEIVDNAITLAKTNPLADTGLNENTNGNALSLICKDWLNGKR